MKSAPRVYTISTAHSFVDSLAKGVLAKYGSDPLLLSSATILLPNRRAVRALRDAFLVHQGQQPMLLPTLRAIADVDEGEIETISAGLGLSYAEVKPAIPAMQRQALLTKLVAHWHGGRDQMAPAQAWRLASELATFLDHMHTAEVSFDQLKDLAPENLAVHWQQTLEFLGIVTEHWPAIVGELGMQDPARHRNQSIRMLAEHLGATQPKTPIIAAGSTGSIPATATLLGTVARLPEGCVVLPGLDQDMPDDVWQAVDETHPQNALKILLESANISRHEVEHWPSLKANPNTEVRSKLITTALLPAAKTSEWMNTSRTKAAERCYSGMSAIVAPTRREEAAAIALALREVLETPGKTAALVTPDRQLALHVRAALQRWGIAIDDSGGDQALNSVPGRLLALIATAVSDHFGPLSFLSLLQHPLVSIGMERSVYLHALRRLDRFLLRGVRPAGGLNGLTERMQTVCGDKTNDLNSEDAAFLKKIVKILRPLEDLLSAPASLEHSLSTHIEVAEALAEPAAGDGAEELWRGDAGTALANHLSDVLDHAEALSVPSAESYDALFFEIMKPATVRPSWNKHPRLAIWGPLEARLQQRDLMVLGGLNEGVWPAEQAMDPWMSRGMRADFGLPPVERRIGQSAHDFIMACSGSKVLLTRSEKTDGTPTVPSRWWFRIEACAGSEIPRETRLLDWALQLDRVKLKPTLQPPAPRPPLAARPTQLSVTQIQEWMRDPYALYAKKILDLSSLDPIDDRPNASQKGTLLHEALELFLLHDGPREGQEGLDRLLSIGRDVFKPVLSQPTVYAFWWPRFERIANWFAAHHPIHSKQYETVLVEGWAKGDLATGQGEHQFTVIAKADRIDKNRATGAYVVIDYKTGVTPTEKQVEAGFAPQLPLEAWLVQSGAFKDLSAGPVEDLVFWKISGGEPVQEQKRPVKDIAQAVKDAENGLCALVKAFSDENTPYLSNPRPTITGYGEYDHLARVKEWQNGAPLALSIGAERS